MSDEKYMPFWIFVVIAVVIASAGFLKAWFGHGSSKAQRKLVLRFAIPVLFISHVVFTVFSFYYISLSGYEDLSDGGFFVVVVVLAMVPVLIGGILIIPYRFILAPIYIFLSKRYYPELEKQKYFPQYLVPGMASGGAILFLLVRGYRIANASRSYIFISEIYRIHAVMFMMSIGWFSGVVLVYLCNWVLLNAFGVGMQL